MSRMHLIWQCIVLVSIITDTIQQNDNGHAKKQSLRVGNYLEGTGKWVLMAVKLSLSALGANFVAVADLCEVGQD